MTMACLSGKSHGKNKNQLVEGGALKEVMGQEAVKCTLATNIFSALSKVVI